MKPTRVLHVKPGEWGTGGVENFIMSMFEHMDRTRMVFDVLTIGQPGSPSPHDHRLDELGGMRFTYAERHHGPTMTKLGPVLQLCRLVREKQYSVVHIHTGSPFHGIYAFAARAAGAHVVVLHSHTSGGRTMPVSVRLVLDRMLEAAPTARAACSEAASRWLFPRRLQRSVRIFHNGIDIQRFRYDPMARERVRAELSLGQGQLVLGHVGRFSWEKNHAHMLRLLAELLTTASPAPDDPVLVLVGDGQERPAVEALAEDLGLSAHVRFLGQRDDIADLMQAMDLLLLPSEAEGLGIVAVEAQASGLPCLLSTGVPREVDVTGRCRFVPVDAPTSDWISAIHTLAALERRDNTDQVRAAGYDAARCAEDLEDFYNAALASKAQHHVGP